MAFPVQISSFFYPGTAQLNDIFGFFQAPTTVQIQRLQLSAQTGAVGGDITVTLVDVSGNSLGASVTMLSASNYKDQPLSAFVNRTAGQTVRAKITGVDAGVAGWFTLNLIGATASFPAAPCCCGPYPSSAYYGCGC